MTIIELKKEYLKQLDIIKNDANGKSVKEQHLEKLRGVYTQIKIIEPNANIDSPEIIASKFIDKVDVKEVVWYDNPELLSTQEDELNALESVRMMAYVWVKRNHPFLNEQGDKFGQIVNARMQLIIASRQ